MRVSGVSSWSRVPTGSALRSTQIGVDARLPEHPLEESVGPAVDIVADDDPLARADEPCDGRGRCRAARERQTVRATLQGRDGPLEPFPRRVAGPRVLPAATWLPHGILGERAGLVDGRRHGARQLIGLLARMDREGAGQPFGVRFVRHRRMVRGAASGPRDHGLE